MVDIICAQLGSLDFYFFCFPWGLFGRLFEIDVLCHMVVLCIHVGPKASQFYFSSTFPVGQVEF